MSKPKQCAVIAHVPIELKRRLDAAAKKSRRSRSAEMLLRLEDSLRKSPVLAVAEAQAAQ